MADMAGLKHANGENASEAESETSFLDVKKFLGESASLFDEECSDMDGHDSSSRPHIGLDDDLSLNGDHASYFDEDDLLELESLRDQEIDALVDHSLLPKDDRWNPECRNGFTFVHPEMILCVTTGSAYPVQALQYEVKNISLPRVVVDQLRVDLRDLYHLDCSLNTYEKWCDRAASQTGCFVFEMTALHLANHTDARLKMFRKDPTYWRNQRASLRYTDYRLSHERRRILRDHYGVEGLFPDTGLEAWDPNRKRAFDPLNPTWEKKEIDMTEERKLNFAEVQTQREILDSMFGIDPSSIQGHDLANSILGRTPDEVCKDIPEAFRVLHIESVVRSDRVARLYRAQTTIRNDILKMPLNELKGCLKHETRARLGKRVNDKEILADLLVTPELTFHCTREDLVPSIIRQGFLRPKDEKDVRCGSTYGRGIYSSPDPFFSLMYTDIRGEAIRPNEFAGLKLIACAVITGRCKYMLSSDNWRERSEPYPGADCHAGNQMDEYVVFDDAQIIPCYVIHLDLGRDAVKYLAEHKQEDMTSYISNWHARKNDRTAWARSESKLAGPDLAFPGDRQRAKEALLAKAKKYFPYGYGASSGANFQILEVGEVDEDEEEYGVYQTDRHEGADNDAARGIKDPVVDIWNMHDHTTLALDADGTSDQEHEEGIDNDDDPANVNNDINAQTADPDATAMMMNDWHNELGPLGRTKFDEYYDARRAKNKKTTRTPKRTDW